MLLVALESHDDQNDRDDRQRARQEREEDDVGDGVEFVVEDEIVMVDAKHIGVETSRVIHRGEVVGHEVEVCDDEHENDVDELLDHGIAHAGHVTSAERRPEDDAAFQGQENHGDDGEMGKVILKEKSEIASGVFVPGREIGWCLDSSGREARPLLGHEQGQGWKPVEEPFYDTARIVDGQTSDVQSERGGSIEWRVMNEQKCHHAENDAR
jgi:hypothetical protein